MMLLSLSQVKTSQKHMENYAISCKDKTECSHGRLRNPTARKTLKIGNQCIPSKETARFLGVMVDNKLNWKGQCTAVLAKGHLWIIQVNRLARISHGIPAKCLRHLYLSVAVPRILYAADIFLTPQKRSGHKGSQHTSTKNLASIQRKAALMITGAMKSTATDIVEVM